MERRRRVALRKAHTLKRIASVGIVVGVGDTLRGLLPPGVLRASPPDRAAYPSSSKHFRQCLYHSVAPHIPSPESTFFLDLCEIVIIDFESSVSAYNR